MISSPNDANNPYSMRATIPLVPSQSGFHKAGSTMTRTGTPTSPSGSGGERRRRTVSLCLLQEDMKICVRLNILRSTARVGKADPACDVEE